jgi:transcriptional antiterminator NusG
MDENETQKMADIAPVQPKEIRNEVAQNESDARWYTIHTYAGYENAVERNLKQRIESLGMEEKIFDVIVPTEKKIRVKSGKRIVEEEKIYPGYILVRMIVDDDSWFVVRNTPRVTGFVGAGNTPVPMEESEVTSLMKRMNADAPKHRIDLMKEDPVIIADGPFKDLEGKVSDIDEDRGKVKVMVSMFGRETPVELDFLQIRKL